jgi:hypothetical protein
MGMGNAVYDVVGQEEISGKIKSHMVYKPLTNICTLGIYSLFDGWDDDKSQNMDKSLP